MNLFADPILAIETSCDETSAAIVQGSQVLSNIVSSQTDLHKKWGGVVPEAAARAHVESIVPVFDEALTQSGVPLCDVRGIAITNRPGLVGALSVGVSAAKALAFSSGLPLLGIHHLEGHLCSVFVLNEIPFPHIALIVSGGHTELVMVKDPGSYSLIGQTRDDAAGEAFDKGARLLGLGYPGGKAIEDAAIGGSPDQYALPRGLSGDTCDFSFSGLKTAMYRLVEKEGANLDIADAAASLQEAIVSVLTERTILAAERSRVSAVSLVGGVAANKRLRSALEGACKLNGMRLLAPPFDLCTDNAAMIGLAAAHRFALGQRDGFDLDVYANADLP